MAYGYHLVLDLLGCGRDTCNDMSGLYDFLCRAVEHLHMNTQGAPHVIRTDHSRYPDQEGLSAWVPLVESSVVVHTVAPKGFVSIDVYTCHAFDAERMAAFCVEWFGGRLTQKGLIERGAEIR